MRCFVLVAIVVVALPVHTARAGESELRAEALKTLRKATDFFCTRVATEGGYLWRYSDDLARREGEGKATATMVWVQPPGTPSVGMAYLAAYEATGDAYYLEAARDTARALVKGQLRSGGWDYRIEFDPQKRSGYAYRVDKPNEKGRNVTTLDDDTTQAALRLLMRVDKALGRKDKQIHEAAEYALTCLLKAQYPNGAWPQRYDQFPDPKKHPVKKASFPESWSRTFPGVDYRGFYTLNDNTLADVVDTLLEAAQIYDDAKYRAAVDKAGGFLLLAQLPEPQPAWAQQYDFDMHPAWARKFEPASVTGGESFGAMRTLLRIYRETGDKKYLEPIPRALEYFKRSQLADGRLARFYELKTNKPLFFTKDYKLTYSDADVPTHYAFKVANRTAVIAKEYERLRKLDPAELKRPTPPGKPRVTDDLKARVKQVIATLDKEGRWVENGRLRNHGADDPTRRIIECRAFIQNLGVLTTFLAASKNP
jgi:PelA/Pel-15E family pectate lyase